MKPNVPTLSEEEREIIREDLMHDLAGLDGTTEEEAQRLYARLVTEGRIDPAKSAAAHQRLLTRLGVARVEPAALTAAECLRAYEEYRQVPRSQLAQELGIDLATLAGFEADQTPLPRDDQAFVETCRRLAQRIRAHATRRFFRSECTSEALTRLGPTPREDWLAEARANYFAAELLMPADEITVQLRRVAGPVARPSGEELIATLSRHFDVSRVAMEVRLADLQAIRAGSSQGNLC
jgi:transcriptional regulator with XRE-family HTH domain